MSAISMRTYAICFIFVLLIETFGGITASDRLLSEITVAAPMLIVSNGRHSNCHAKGKSEIKPDEVAIAPSLHRTNTLNQLMQRIPARRDATTCQILASPASCVEFADLEGKVCASRFS